MSLESPHKKVYCKTHIVFCIVVILLSCHFRVAANGFGLHFGANHKPKDNKISTEKIRQEFFRQVGENLALSENHCCSLGVFQHIEIHRNSDISKKICPQSNSIRLKFRRKVCMQFVKDTHSSVKSQRVEFKKSRTVLQNSVRQKSRNKFGNSKFQKSIYRFQQHLTTTFCGLKMWRKLNTKPTQI